MTYTRKDLSEHLVYHINGDMAITDFASIDELHKELKQFTRKDKYNFIWDLTNAQVVDSTGLSLIAVTVGYAIKHNKSVKICGANPDNTRLFKLVKMGGNIKHFSTVDEALEMLVDEGSALELVEQVK